MSEVYLYSNISEKEPKLNAWCAFPAVYNFGMSALGYLSVFKTISEIEGINAERIFTDTETTKIRPKDTDIISFSFSFELDFLGILKILEKYEIPFLSKDRNEQHPLIYGGGPVLSANPEPFCEFFDFIMTGDAEVNLKKVFELLRDNKDKPKSERLKIISKLEGIYVPPLKKAGYKVKKATSELKCCVSTPILTEKSYFPNTYIIEIERGCTQQCAFCLTSFLNKPIRFCPLDKIKEKIDEGLQHTNKLALLGAMVCAHPNIDDICEYIIKKSEENSELEVSVSSLRADNLSDKMLEMLHKCGQRSATIAIEAGSERLREVINKRLEEKDIYTAVEKLVKHGFKGIKIYGMTGLPTETYEDIDAFINICKNIKNKYKGFTITPSFSSFIAKAQTPFQFAARESIKELEKKNEYLKKEFAKIGIKARTGSAKWDYVQAFLSRGGRELTPYLIEVYKLGGNLGAFKSALKNFGMLNLDKIALEKINPNEELPWDFIEFSRPKEFLKSEYKRLIGDYSCY